MKKCFICGIEIKIKYNESKKYFKEKKTCSPKCFHIRHSKLMKGREVSEETRRKIGLKHKGKKISPETTIKRLRTLRKNGNELLGSKNHKWNGGRLIDKDGYIQVRISTGYYRREHRVLMEQYLGRKLGSEEMVHHINENKKDNRISNLQILTRSEHAKLHQNLKH